MLSKKAEGTRLIAVTGATGLIGRRLVPSLQNAALHVRALVRATGASGSPSGVVGDLRDKYALGQLVEGADAVVHLAGVAHTRLRSVAEEEQAQAVNVEGTRSLINAATEAGVRHFVFASSAHVYRGQEGLDLREDAPTEGDTAYGRMKLEAEETVLAARSSNIRISILRPCLTYGPGVRFNLQSLLRAVRRGYYVHVRDVDVIRSLASVDTVSAAIFHLLDARTTHSVFNIADRSPVHVDDWVNHLADLMQVRHPYGLSRSAMSILAGFGSAFQRVGLHAPLSRDSLHKLTSSFSLNTDRLASTGFSWPETRETVLREMISAEFGSGSR